MSSTSAISPKKSPAPSRLMDSPSFVTSASPSSSTKNSRPAAPCLVSSLPAGKSISSAICAISPSSPREQLAKSGTRFISSTFSLRRSTGVSLSLRVGSGNRTALRNVCATVSTLISEEGHFVRLHRLLLLLPIVLVAALLPGSSIAADPIVLKGTVGPGFVITLRDASNNTVKRVLPGDYVIQVDDRSVDHNFHFKGPGVDMKTEVETTGPAVWSVTLVDGKYTFVCDPHAGIMNGVLNVGVA